MPIALVVAEVSTAMKKVGSTEGMRRAATSPDYATWVQNSAAQLRDMQAAIQASDIEKIGTIAEANALAMHDLNRTARLDPFTYFTNDTTDILTLVADMRRQGLLAFATLDAGPNVKIITTQAHAPLIVSQLQAAMPDLHLEIATSGAGMHYDD